MFEAEGMGLALRTGVALANKCVLGLYGGSVGRASPTGSCHDIPFRIEVSAALSKATQKLPKRHPNAPL